MALAGGYYLKEKCKKVIGHNRFRYNFLRISKHISTIVWFHILHLYKHFAHTDEEHDEEHPVPNTTTWNSKVNFFIHLITPK